MKTIILALIWTIFWLSIESTLFTRFPTDTIRCDFVFLVVVAMGFTMESGGGLLPVFLMGLFTDGFSSAPFGVYTLVYLITFGVIRFTSSIIYVRSHIAQFVWVATATIAASWVEVGIIALIYKNPQFLENLMWRFLPQAIWNGLTGLIIIPVFNWYLNISIEKILRPKGLVLK